MMPAGRPRKYGNVPTTVDGIRFDSKAEARHYAELRLLEKAGHICALELQPEYKLPGGIKYRADFRYFTTADAKLHVVDVKGVLTQAYKLKAKLMKSEHGIDVEVVK